MIVISFVILKGVRISPNRDLPQICGKVGQLKSDLSVVLD